MVRARLSRQNYGLVFHLSCFSSDTFEVWFIFFFFEKDLYFINKQAVPYREPAKQDKEKQTSSTIQRACKAGQRKKTNCPDQNAEKTEQREGQHPSKFRKFQFF